ncbi:hypothetical protein YN1_1180 [Nanoarchaeota archaeon]
MNLTKISFIFPIYKESKYVEENIKKILDDPYPNNLKEIILTVDVPKEDFLNKLKEIKEKYKENIKIVISKERRGKVSATNDAVKYSTGNVLIFLDSDVIIEYINLEKIVEEIYEYDLVEFYKEVIPKGWIGKMLHIEYSVYYDVALKILNKKHRTIVTNGAGFGVKREIWEKVNGYTRVYAEDVDFVFKAQENGSKYYMSKNIRIKIEPLEKFRSLIDQKKRWTFGALEVLVNHLNFVIKFAINEPLEVISIILLLWLPYIIWLYVYIFIPAAFLYNLSIQLYETLSTNVSIIYLLILKPISIYNFLYGLYLTLAYILITSIYIYLLISISKKRLYNPLYFFLFSIVYIPVYEIIFIYVFLYYVIFERAPRMNWKV